MSVSRLFVARLLLAGACLSVPAMSSAQAASPPADDPDEPVIRWRDRPSIQLGEVRIDLRLKLQFDWRSFDPDLVDEDTFDARMRRVGLRGEVTEHLEYEIEREIDPLDARPWKDVFVNWRTFRQAEVQAGRFKIPFGLEQLVSASEIDFATRALISSTIAAARDEGVMVHGRFLRRGLTYAVGAFDDDGDNGRLREPQFVQGQAAAPEIGTAVAARVTVAPLRSAGRLNALREMRVGAAYTRAGVPEGLNSLRGRTALDTNTFFEPVYVKGRRQRLGLEVDLTSGPVSVRSEWMQAREAREEQGLGNADLSDFVSTGWYLSGAWVVTGEPKGDGVVPRQPLFRGGFGAVELAARYDELEFTSASKEGLPVRSPRAEHVFPNRDAVWTVGVNWFPARWVRVTANGVREHFDDPATAPLPNAATLWSGVLRLQVRF